MNKKIKKYIEELYILYDKYMVNREYKSRSFKTNELFISTQHIIGEEIEKNENELFKLIQETINQFFPTVQVLRYDSRFLKKNRNLLGNVLCKNIPDKEEARTIQLYFDAETNYSISIQRLEDFDDETQKRLIEMFNKNPQ